MELALKVRTALGLTLTEAGKLLFGYPTGSTGSACKTWRRWENGERQLPLSTSRYFELILKLVDSIGVDATILILKLRVNNE